MTTYDETELAALAGTTVERVRRMTDLRILEPREGRYATPDIGLVRVAESLEGSGIELEDLGALIDRGVYSMGWAPMIFPEPVPVTTMTMRAACEELDMPPDYVRRIFTVALELPAPEPDDLMREDDLELLRVAALVFALAGRDEDVGIAGARYFGDNLRRLAESQQRFFREHFEEPMFTAGMTQREAIDQLVSIAAPLLPLGQRVVELLYRRHLEHFVIEDVIGNMERTIEATGLARPQAAHLPAIAFCDLTGSTSLTERLGDEAAARIADRLGETLRVTSAEHGGRVVKLLGDGAMLHFHGPAGAARAGLQLAASAERDGLPPLRMGVHVGPVVYRDGDYYGRTVIVAARITDRIGPGEVVLSADAVAEVTSSDLVFDPIGRASLKGVAEPVELFRGRAAMGP